MDSALDGRTRSTARAGHGARVVETPDLAGGQVQDVREDLLGVLAEQRCSADGQTLEGAELEWLPGTQVVPIPG